MAVGVGAVCCVADRWTDIILCRMEEPMTKTFKGIVFQTGIEELQRVKTMDDLAQWFDYYTYDKPEKDKSYKNIKVDIHVEE